MANTNVRNVGSIGGNLMLKHKHNDFPSDIFTLLTAVGAQITIKAASGKEDVYTLPEWLSVSMDKKIIFYITLPKLTSQHRFM